MIVLAQVEYHFPKGKFQSTKVSENSSRACFWLIPADARLDAGSSLPVTRVVHPLMSATDED